MSEIVECPSCGCETYASALACPHCGEPVPNVWKKASQASDDGPDSMVECPGCGHQTYADLPECAKCGRRLPSADQVERLQRDRKGGALSRMLDHLLAGFRN